MTYFKKYRLFVIKKVFFISFVILCALTLTNSTKAKTNTSYPKIKVIAQKVEYINKPQLRETIGKVVTIEGGIISAELAGIIQQVFVHIGQTVEKNTVIAKLNQDKLKLELDAAKTNLDQSKAFSNSQLASLNLAKLQLEREKSLKNSPAFSKATFENRQQEYEIANANYAQALSQYQAKKIEYNLAKLNLEKSEIKAPFTGIVTSKMIHPGLYVKPGDSIIELKNNKNLEIEVNIPNNLIKLIKIGDNLDISDRVNDKMQAKVVAIVAQENTVSRTIPIRLSPNDITLKHLVLNQSIIVRIPDLANNTLTVKKDALISKNNNFYIFKVNQDSKAEFTPVKIGAFIKNNVEILSGLNANEMVIIQGNDKLHHMQDVSYIKTSN